MSDARHLGDGFVGDRLHRDHSAAAECAVGGDQGAGAAVFEPGGDGGRAEAREDRQRDRADLGTGQEGDDGLGEHRQEEPDAVAPPDAQPLQGIRQPVRLHEELAVAQAACAAVLPLPEHRRLIVAVGAGVAVEALCARLSVPPTNQRAQGRPRVVSSTRSYG